VFSPPERAGGPRGAGTLARIRLDGETIMKAAVFTGLALAPPRAARIAAMAMAGCGAALASPGAQAADYNFVTINDPADIPPPPGAGGGAPFDFQFGFYEKGGVFTMVNNPKTPDCSVSGACDSGVITENQLIGVNNSDLALGFYNDRHGDSHGYTFDIGTKTFSADINDPLAVSTVTAAINNSGKIAGFFTDSGGVTHGFIDNGGVFSTVDPAGSTETQLLGLNDKGIADGFAVIGGVQHGLLFDSLTDTFTILDPPEARRPRRLTGVVVRAICSWLERGRGFEQKQHIKYVLFSRRGTKRGRKPLKT
jgi:hypothetical protein